MLGYDQMGQPRKPPENPNQPENRQNISDRIVAFLRERPAASRREIVAALEDTTEGSVRYQLDKLKASNRLRRVGPDRGGHWMVVDGHDAEGSEETDACAGDHRRPGETQPENHQRTTRKPPGNHQKTARNEDQPPEPLPLADRILALLHQNPSASRRELAATLGTTKSIVRYRLDKLRSAGKIARVGSRQGWSLEGAVRHRQRARSQPRPRPWEPPMTTVGELERETQRRVIRHFRDQLGCRFLGNWHERDNNRNIEPEILTRFLKRQGHSPALITKALDKLGKAAALGGSKTLYEANRDVYSLLRYGVKVRPGLGEHTVTVHLIDWKNPAANDFAIAEEVTVAGKNTKRPDIVVYVNGIAVRRPRTQALDRVGGGGNPAESGQPEEGLHPAVLQHRAACHGRQRHRRAALRRDRDPREVLATVERKPARSPTTTPTSPLLAELGHLCAPDRLLELIHDFVVFDAGDKKICRHNQYFGVKAARKYVRRREGGIIWHTQGSGKSLTMVWLAKWIRELKDVDGRLLIVTDRKELDEQIEMVFKGVEEDIYRTESGADLAEVLRDPAKSLTCSLVHKFGSSEEGNIDRYVTDLRSHMSRGLRPPGEIFVFVDECHRTQSGKLHRAMKAILPGATLIGFTGTPLLRSDKQRSIEIFGPYIHTYKYDEAVDDEVVLDLRYEAAGHRSGHHIGGEDRPVVRLENRGVQRPGPRAAKAAVGHDEEGHEFAAPDPGDRGRHPDGHGDAGPPQERPRKRDARIRQRLRGLPLLRGVQGDRVEGQVRHRHLLQPGGRGHHGRRDGGGAHREASQVRCLPEDARRPLRRDRGQGHAQSRPVRAGGQAAVRERALGR